MTSEDSFVPIGKILYGKYQYQNAHYDCVKKNDLKPKSNFDW
jgi:translation initiation factor IF-3